MNTSGDPVFSPNSAIDTAIKEILPHFSLKSQQRMRKAIHDAAKSAQEHNDENTDAGARHVFREFLPACFLNQHGFAFEYEKLVQGKRPDWLDESSLLMLDSYTFERGGTSSLLDRLTAVAVNKCSRYQDVITAQSLRFILAVYLDFLTGISLDECREDAKSFQTVFTASKNLWAIVFFTEAHFVARTQYYGFLCLCADSAYRAFSNWPFDTLNLNELNP
jgi:hypothetical protein